MYDNLIAVSQQHTNILSLWLFNKTTTSRNLGRRSKYIHYPVYMYMYCTVIYYGHCTVKNNIIIVDLVIIMYPKQFVIT